MVETLENNVMDRVLDPLRRQLNPEAAQAIAALQLDDTAQARMDELADKNTEGQLTPEERAELEAWVSACDVVAILQFCLARYRVGRADASRARDSSCAEDERVTPPAVAEICIEVEHARLNAVETQNPSCSVRAMISSCNSFDRSQK